MRRLVWAVALAAILTAGAGEPAPGPWLLDLKRPDARRAVVSVLTGVEPLEWAGFTLAAGDVNEDGVSDLVIGAPGGTDDRPSRRGRLYVILGRTEPLPRAIELVPRRAPRPATTRPQGGASSAKIDPNAPATSGSPEAAATRADIVIEGPGDFDHFGQSLAVADMDGDGTADIVAGAPRADGPLEARSDCGEVFVIFGSTTLPARIELESAAPGARVARIIGRSAGDALGTALAVGDVMGNALNDLVMGAPLADGQAGTMAAQDVGEAILLGGSATWPAVLDLRAGLPGARMLRGRDPADQAGSALAIGDFDGDRMADVAVGARGADGPDNQRPDAGEVMLVWGMRETAQPVMPQPPVIIFGAAIGDLAGSSLGMGDVNGDKRADLAIGAPLADGPAGSRLDAGEVRLLLGRPRADMDALRGRRPEVHLPGRPMEPKPLTPVAPVVTVLPDIDSAAALPGMTVLYGADPGDHTSVRAVHDLDGDGLADLVIAAEDSSGRRNGRAGAGEVRLVPGRAVLPQDLDLRDEHIPAIFGAVGGGHLGVAALVADLDGDARPELILSAPLAGQSLAGRIYVVKGDWRGWNQ
ncbi:MAG: hypothetical protein ACREAA_00035 [Candidatus Polarisedimenticolia bacterium]